MFFKAKKYLSGDILLNIMEIFLRHFLSFSFSALAERDNGAGSCGHRKSVQSVVYIYKYEKYMHLPQFFSFYLMIGAEAPTFHLSYL